MATLLLITHYLHNGYSITYYFCITLLTYYWLLDSLFCRSVTGCCPLSDYWSNFHMNVLVEAPAPGPLEVS